MAGEVSQRDYMRKLAIELSGDRTKVCAAYAQAERDGIVARSRNTHDRASEDYAAALWEDGIAKGWMEPKAEQWNQIAAPTTAPNDHLRALSVAELLVLHAQVSEELRDRGVVRSANNPTGDLAEYLFCRAFGWQQAANSERGYDAIGSDGIRYQIKGRRIHRRNKSRQLSAIRDIDGGHFDMLAGVLFDDDFNVVRAALVPIAFVVERSTYIAHTNSNKFMLRDDVWAAPGVRDVTTEIKAAMP